MLSCAGVCKGWYLYARLCRIPICCEKMPRFEISCKYDCNHCLSMEIWWFNLFNLRVLAIQLYPIACVNGLMEAQGLKSFIMWLYICSFSRCLSTHFLGLTLFEMSQKDSQIQQLFMKIDYTGDGKIEWVWIIHCFPLKSQTCLFNRRRDNLLNAHFLHLKKLWASCWNESHSLTFNTDIFVHKNC